MNSVYNSVKDFFDSLNFATFILAGLGALAALWLNNQYVSQEVYNKDKEILLLKIESLETETQAIRYMAMTNSEDIKQILPVLNRIDQLIANLITPSGEVILTENMQQLEVDIAIIKKDIEYMKNKLWPQD